MNVCTAEKFTGSDLLTRFKKDIIAQNIASCTNDVRRKLRGFLDKNSVECGKGSGGSIKAKLTTLIQPSTSSDQLGSFFAHDSSFTHFVSGNTGKRDILKSSRTNESLFSGPYDSVILWSVKGQFLQDCTGFEVPKNQQLSVLHIVSKENALCHFTDHIKTNVVNGYQAFDKIKKHFITEAHIITYTSE